MLEESTVRIKVYLPPYLNHSRVDEHGYVEIEKGARLKDLFKLLKVPFPIGAVHLCRVNYDKADLRQQLQDGDIVSFYSLISGG
jgi:molybdopterin converting factor small subunit